MKNRVLIVEDDLALRPLWEFVLLKQFTEYHLDWAMSAEEAKQMLSASIKFDAPYALIVTDFFLMGVETGLDVLRHAARGFHHCPIILVSQVDEDILRRVYGEALEDMLVLTKPVSASQCGGALDKFFSVDK
ncbi:response regulator [Bdellovibrio sp. 22V]|uniref:response regulator n=1 Tax=Bdellovibrio sp. 22V TaxID=3044166 RepID=UPI00254386C6|nr:response regulator [Bdellovibrio sp. 22V]WII72267.1 response regulator [Bdellovibrio sp. 22V]